MKTLASLNKYVILPNIGFYGGFEFDGEDIFLCDDHDMDQDYDFKVKQYIKDSILITDMERTYTLKNLKKVTEISHLEVELEKGQLLVYVEGTGFTVPERDMCTVKDAMEQYRLLEEFGNDTGTGTEESASTD